MEDNQQSQNNPDVKINERKSNNLLFLAVAFLILVALVSLLAWQQNKVSSLNKEVAALKETQIPQNKFESYEDCTNNGGAILNTINGQFNACLGGNEDRSGELPQYQAFLQYSAQNLPRITESKKTENENKVTSRSQHSQDLIEFLRFDDSGCEPRGEYEIVKEVPERFAFMKYGCDKDGQVQSDNPPTIIAMKLADGWATLSPTNNMDDKGRPSCLLVDMFKISKDLVLKCFENTGYNNGNLKDVVYP